MWIRFASVAISVFFSVVRAKELEVGYSHLATIAAERLLVFHKIIVPYNIKWKILLGSYKNCEKVDRRRRGEGGDKKKGIREM